ncbi:ABC transporter permease [Acuticoccus sediminis]|uniref:TRAP transporter large permease protein n=1 Tax=Acuticoccus sediminis TaxID=2184697 RepID=A0A8B2NUU5_9HYPH|nr:TRAP transporter large permease [Acuticoccus sediminis]RAI02078.1 ABC transporter permease [Acuticoccus sediminis]
MLMVVLLLVLCALILIGTPIAVALAATAIGTMWWATGPDLLFIFIQRLYVGTTSFPLLAIPFFIVAGNLMNTGGITERIFAAAQLFVGRIRGGLAHVNVLASVIFSGMSGSAVADAAGLGIIEVKAMREAGYSGRFAATITAVSSTIGPIMPPSIPLVIYGSLANVSIGALFLAGVMPGALMALALMIVISVVARVRKLPVMEGRPAGSEARRVFFGALPAMLTPVLIIGGILGGLATPTEAAVLATAYALFLGTCVYRELRWRDIPDILWLSGRQTVQVMFIIAAAAPFGWVLIQQQIPNAVIEAMFSLTSEPWAILLLVNAILLILGMFIEGVAIIIIAFPILLPVMLQIGVDPVHFGIIMVLNLMIGLVTPPVGMCLFAVSSVSNVPISDMVREMWPYMLALLAVLLLVTFVPETVLWLPHALGYGS